MDMDTIIAAAVIVVIVALAAGYVYKAKKRGQKCIGCPMANTCSSSRNGSCSCGNDSNDTAE